MPWTVSDVDKHKKGLTPQQKAQWVAIANSVMKKCMANGGTDATCAPSAIQQASGVVGNHVRVNVKNEGYVVQELMHQGKKHIVVPVVMMVEGVHSGNMGPLLHLADELGRFPESWNGIPIVIDHPVNNEGMNVSANSPDIIDSIATVGRVYNTYMEESKLKAEAYLDVEKLRNTSPVALAAVMNGEPLEVSIGVFTEEEQVPGIWNNENYTSIARNHRPDHLALLPGGTGACSWNDGCGIRANSKEGGKMDKTKDISNVTRLIGANANEGYKTLVQNMQNKLNTMDSDSSVYYLEDVFDSYVVYRCSMRVGGSKLFKQTYSADSAGTIEFTDDPVEVNQKIDYVPVTHKMERTNFNKKGGPNMNGKEGCGQCMEKVIAIINSNATPFTAADREWLLVQDEAILDKLIPKEPAKVVPVVNSHKDAPVTLTSDQILNALSAEDRAAWTFGKKQLAAKRKQMVDVIQANTSKELWPDAVLSTLGEDFLEKLYESVNVNENEEDVVDYSLQGNARRIVDNSDDEDMLYPTGITVK
jgi:hypothetical protein